MKVDEGEGYYWIRFAVPMSDSGGVLSEHWSEPTVAKYVRLDWYPVWDTASMKLADQFSVEVLSERLPAPVVTKSRESEMAERIMAVVEAAVEAVPMEGDNAGLEYDRKELLAAIEAVLGGSSREVAARQYRNDSPFTEQVIRQNAADGNTEFLVTGASTTLRQGDRVVATFRDWSRAGSEPDQLVYWRGSVDDFATDVKALLTPDQLEALSAAVSLAWLEKKAGV